MDENEALSTALLTCSKEFRCDTKISFSAIHVKGYELEEQFEKTLNLFKQEVQHMATEIEKIDENKRAT